jgi:XTP/dITP diphosphohydrolase
VQTLILATGNAHKAQELRAILGEGFQYRTLKEFPDAPVAIEDGRTFVENALKKARCLADWVRETNRIPGSRVAILADDSGLEVDALQGAPGVHSARFAALDDDRAGNSPDAENSAKLLRLLSRIPTDRRTARFRCALAWLEFGPARAGETVEQIFEGTCEGRIALAPSGNGGFGYDPLFVPEGYAVSFAELGYAVKGRFSHRARALALLLSWLKGRTADSPTMQVRP